MVIPPISIPKYFAPSGFFPKLSASANHRSILITANSSIPTRTLSIFECWFCFTISDGSHHAWDGSYFRVVQKPNIESLTKFSGPNENEMAKINWILEAVADK
jgi:hypothetical protein